MMTNKIPTHIRRELEALGVVMKGARDFQSLPTARTQTSVADEEPKQIVREYKFRMPNLDENGEPDF